MLLNSIQVIQINKIYQKITLFFILFITIFFISYFHTKGLPCNLDFNDSAQNLIKKCGDGADYSQYAKLALDYYQFGSATENNTWIANNWPPGVPMIFYISLVLFGIKGSILLFPFLLNSFLWSLCFYLFITSLISKEIKNNLIIFLLIIFLFNSYLFKYFFFAYGIVESNGWGSVFFVLGLLLLFNNIKNKNFEKNINKFGEIILISSLFFFSTLFRLNIDILIYFIIFFFLIKIFFNYLLLVFFNKKYFKFSFKKFPIDFLILKVFLLTLLISIPLKIHSRSLLNSKSSMAAHVNWMPSKILNETGGGYAVEGGGNLACILNPILCEKLSSVQLEYDRKNNILGDNRVYFNHYWPQEFYFAITLSEFIKQPLKWFYIKWIKVFPNYWFNNGLAAGASGDYNLFDKFLDFTILIMLLFILIKIITLKANNIVLINIPLIISYLLIFNFYIMEPRYFIPMKAIILFSFLLSFTYKKKDF
jgi:hypothetical protein